MKQKRHGRTKGRGEEVAKQWTAPIQRLSVDTMFVSVSDTNERASASGNNLCTTIRDMYSGLGVVLPGYARKMSDVYYGLKHFAGAVGSNSPDVVVKSDAAKEIVNAIKELGWHADTSVANVWPHNTVHERWHLTAKNSTRCSMYQSGFNEKCWDHAVIYSGVALSITNKAPFLDWERDPSRPGGAQGICWAQATPNMLGGASRRQGVRGTN